MCSTKVTQMCTLTYEQNLRQEGLDLQIIALINITNRPLLQADGGVGVAEVGSHRGSLRGAWVAGHGLVAVRHYLL